MRADADRAAAARRRPASSGRAGRGMGRDLLALAKLVAYVALLILSVKMASMYWEAVESRRAELAAAQEALTPPFPKLSILSSGQENWADPALVSSLKKAISPGAGTTAVYVKSLNTGATAEIDDNRIYPSASLFKVPILVEVLRQQSLGMFSMDTPVKLEQKHWADGSGVLQAQIGKQFPVSELLDLMIRVSDNVAALALLDLVGTDNVNLTLQANGLEATRLRIGSPSRDWGGPPGVNTTTAHEMGLLMEKIATGNILNQAASREAMRLLSLPQQASWLPNQLPSGVAVARKSGELDGIRHEAGVVYGPRSQYVVVVLNENIGNYNEAARTISGVARAAYDYFDK